MLVLAGDIDATWRGYERFADWPVPVLASAIESVFDVPPQAFDPPPRVQSAVVRMTPHAVPAPVDLERLGSLVTAAFSQRRKLLRHGLGAWLERAGYRGRFDLQRRAEEVPVDEYVGLANEVCGNEKAADRPPRST